MISKTELHRLVDELPKSELDAAARYLAYLRDTADPLVRFLDDAPEDDEPLTPEDEAAIDEARAEYRRGETRSWEEVREELAHE